MIPNIIHFVFGMAEDFGGKPFSLVHYLSVKSAIEINKPQAAYLHYHFEPQGEWWIQAKRLLTLNKISAPDSFLGRPLIHVAHKSDVVRLQVLKEEGGIYLDLDTISVKPLTDLLTNSFVIGQELKASYFPKTRLQKIKDATQRFLGLVKDDLNPEGLCNAVLLSEKNSGFVNLWLNEYSTFRSKGMDKYWNEHSVFVPGLLAKKHPEKLTELGPFAFHYPLFYEPGLKSMFEDVTVFPDAYLHHLWESSSWDKYLSQLTVDEILNHDTTYNLIARKFL